MTNEDVKQVVHDRLKTVKDLAKGSMETVLLGRKELWKILGSIYALGREAEDTPGWESVLADAVTESLAEDAKVSPATKGDKASGSGAEATADPTDKWNAHDKSVFDNLLYATLGRIESKSRRHYYKTAFNNAKDAGVKKDPAAFAEWVEEKGGVTAAAKIGIGRPQAREPAKLIEEFKSNLSTSEDGAPARIDIEIGESEGDLALLLVQRDADGKSHVIRTAVDPKVLMHFIDETDEALTPAELVRLEREAIFILNRTALKLAKLWRGKLEDPDLKRFQWAVAALAGQPTLATKYFDGDPDVFADVDECDLQVVNRDCHKLDPARYIKDARPMKMVAYSLESETKATKAALEAIPSFLRWKSNPPRCRKQEAK